MLLFSCSAWVKGAQLYNPQKGGFTDLGRLSSAAPSDRGVGAVFGLQVPPTPAVRFANHRKVWLWPTSALLEHPAPLPCPCAPHPQACWMCSRSLAARAGRSSRTPERVGAAADAVVGQCTVGPCTVFCCGRPQCPDTAGFGFSFPGTCKLSCWVTARHLERAFGMLPPPAAVPGQSLHRQPSTHSMVAQPTFLCSSLLRFPQASSSPPTTSWPTTWACSRTRWGETH